MIAANTTGPTLVVVPTPADADRVARAIQFHASDSLPVRTLPPDDVRPYDGISPHPDVVRRRIAAIDLLHNQGPGVVVASGRALVHRVLAPHALTALTANLAVGTVFEPVAWVEQQIRAGYRATHRVDAPGGISARGAVIDIWPTGRTRPVRIELFDDEVEDIRDLDPTTQRSEKTLAEIRIPPAREAVTTEQACAAQRSEPPMWSTRWVGDRTPAEKHSQSCAAVCGSPEPRTTFPPCRSWPVPPSTPSASSSLARTM